MKTEERTLSIFFGRKPKPESGLDCLTCAIFSALVTGNVGNKSVGARESAAPDAAGWLALLRRASQVPIAMSLSLFSLVLSLSRARSPSPFLSLSFACSLSFSISSSPPSHSFSLAWLQPQVRPVSQRENALITIWQRKSLHTCSLSLVWSSCVVLLVAKSY